MFTGGKDRTVDHVEGPPLHRWERRGAYSIEKAASENRRLEDMMGGDGISSPEALDMNLRSAHEPLRGGDAKAGGQASKPRGNRASDQVAYAAHPKAGELGVVHKDKASKGRGFLGIGPKGDLAPLYPGPANVGAVRRGIRDSDPDSILAVEDKERTDGGQGRGGLNFRPIARPFMDSSMSSDPDTPLPLPRQYGGAKAGSSVQTQRQQPVRGFHSAAIGRLRLFSGSHVSEASVGDIVPGTTPGLPLGDDDALDQCDKTTVTAEEEARLGPGLPGVDLPLTREQQDIQARWREKMKMSPPPGGWPAQGTAASAAGKAAQGNATQRRTFLTATWPLWSHHQHGVTATQGKSASSAPFMKQQLQQQVDADFGGEAAVSVSSSGELRESAAASGSGAGSRGPGAVGMDPPSLGGKHSQVRASEQPWLVEEEQAQNARVGFSGP
jgi:hypothetical protein